MKKPDFSDFSITELDIQWVELFDRQIRSGTAGLAMFVAIFSLIIHPHIALFLMVWLLAWGVLYSIFMLSLPFVSKTYASVKRYIKALDVFNTWWKRTQEYFWTSLTGLQFEHELAALYERVGIKAKVTPASGDGGVDIWLDGPNGRQIVQCKAYGKPVGPAVVRELHGTLMHFRVNYAILASTSGFTRGAIEFASGKPIKLLGLSQIIEMQKSVS